MNKSKKIISIVAAAMLAFSTLTLAGCGSEEYEGEKLTPGYDATATVSNNGGFAVEKGNYVYFINGVEESTADNTYGDVVKGSLMRISKTELAEANYDAAQIIIPSLMVAGDHTAGIFIYGEYVYYATPTTDKDTKTGEVENSYLDFKRSTLDGSEAPMDGDNDYFFRLETNSAKYRFVEVDDTVYCMYEEDSKLKSYNVETGDTTVLVAGAKSSFFYDTEDPTNPNVYYTMGVTYDLDEKASTPARYDQVYCVNAASTATEDTKDGMATYTVMNGDTEIASYSFKEDFVEDNGDVDDYTTYPYVNLGSLVLDGVGSAPSPSADKRFNKDDATQSGDIEGYNYTLQSYQNGGIYFTRKAITTTAADTKLYYLADERANWNTVTGNDSLDVVALDTKYANTSALFEIADGTHSYFYMDGSVLKKATADKKGVATTMPLAYGLSSVNLWKVEGNYLYYYTGAANGNNITRINCKGTADDYKQAFYPSEEYQPLTLPLVDWKSDWYKPEFVTDANGKTVVLYCNAQSYGAGSTAYNYIYATKLGTTEEILATQKALDKVNEFIDSYTENSQLQAVMDYYFKTGKQEAFDAVRTVEDLYTDYQIKEFDKFVKLFETVDNEETEEVEGFKGSGILEQECVALIGRMTKKDEKAIAENWANSLLSEKVEETTEESGLPVWAIILIVVGGALVVAGAAVTAIIIVKKKAAQARKEQAIVNAYKRKNIDTTDDKSIDVYADEEATEETVEEVVEETAETVEEAAEETEEAPSEE